MKTRTPKDETGFPCALVVTRSCSSWWVIYDLVVDAAGNAKVVRD